MIDQCPRQRDALRHPAGKMMRISVGETLETDQAHKFIHFFASFPENTARNQASLNVPANREPGKKIWILKNEAPFRARIGNWSRADQKFARIGRIEAGKK